MPDILRMLFYLHKGKSNKLYIRDAEMETMKLIKEFTENEKIKQNCFFEIRCFDYGDGYKAHFVYQDKEKGECVSNDPVYYSFDENKICIIQSLTDKSSR